MNSTVSVVIPVHNRAQLLGRAVTSVLEQGACICDVVIVDDASTDSTVTEAERLSQTDPRIRIVKLPIRAGAQQARNAGMFQGSGEYVAFLDSDDWWTAGAIGSRLEVAHSKRCAVFTDGLALRPDGGLMPLNVPGDLEPWPLKRVLTGPYFMFQSMLIPRWALERAGPFDPTVRGYQEWDAAIALSRQVNFHFDPQKTFVYDTSQPDSMSKDLRADAIAFTAILEKYSDDFRGLLTIRQRRKLWLEACVRYESAGMRDKMDSQALQIQLHLGEI